MYIIIPHHFLHITVYAHIMNSMEQAKNRTTAETLSRWLIPLAALIVFSIWFTIAPPGFLGKADSVGYAICHRIDERSFHVFGRQLPLCARCTGEFYAAGSTNSYAIMNARWGGMHWVGDVGGVGVWMRVFQ